MNSRFKTYQIRLTTPEATEETARRIDSDPAVKQGLIDAATACLGLPNLSVINKASQPFEDIHDYISLSKYHWPNPDTSDGLPWIYRDGFANPEIKHYDFPALYKLCCAVTTLTLAAKLLNSPKYGVKAVQLLRGWFLAPETRMNPNFNHAQFVPGVWDGSGWGIIEASCLFNELYEAVSELDPEYGWRQREVSSFKKWTNEFLSWLIESEKSKRERNSTNNHGTWYDLLVVTLAVYLDRPEYAARQIRESSLRRLVEQIEPDGRQPFELNRICSLDYCRFNLQAWASLAAYARHFDLDLWEEADCRLEKALNVCLPALFNETSWPYPQNQTEKNQVAVWRLLGRLLLTRTVPERYLRLSGMNPIFRIPYCINLNLQYHD